VSDNGIGPLKAKAGGSANDAALFFG